MWKSFTRAPLASLTSQWTVAIAPDVPSGVASSEAMSARAAPDAAKPAMSSAKMRAHGAPIHEVERDAVADGEERRFVASRSLRRHLKPDTAPRTG